MNTDQLLDKLTEAVSFKYKDDSTAPSVLVSRLKKGYYCSVVRYSGPFAKGKQVVCSGRGDCMAQALENAAASFVALAPPPQDPIQELRGLLVKKK